MELIGAAGIDRLDKTKTFEEIHPTIPEGCVLEGGDTSFDYDDYMKRASVEFEVAG